MLWKDVELWHVTVPIVVVLLAVLAMMAHDLDKKLRNKPHRCSHIFKLNDDPRVFSLQGICRQDFYTPELLEQLRALEPGESTQTDVGVFKRMN